MRLGDIATFHTGPFGTMLHQSDYVAGGVPLINPSHIVGGRLRPSRTESVGDATFRRLAAYRLREGDIVLGRRGEMGRCALVGAGEAGWLCGSGSFIVRPSSAAVGFYLQRVLASDESVRFLTDSAIGSTMFNLNHRVLAAVPVRLPSIEEQRAIAEALADFEDSVGTIDALITKKQAMRLAALQELVDDADGDAATVGELGRLLKGKGLTKADVASRGVPCVRYGELYTTHHDWIRALTSHVTESAARASEQLQHGDVLFAGSGETAAEIGKCVAFVGTQRAVAGGDIIVLRGHGQDPIYLGYLLNSADVVAQRQRLGQGDAVVHISSRAIGSLEITLPLVEEQIRRRKILVDIDLDIDVLVERRRKLVAVNAAVADDLLSGRVRLT